MHICLIDDDPRLLATLGQGLTELGHQCETFQSSTAGLTRLCDRSKAEPEVLLLDVMMPELDGWTVLKRLREHGVRMPVLFLTACRDIDDRVRGLDASADDYVVKPFAFKELLARIQAVLRRNRHREPLVVEQLVVHRDRPRVEYAGRSIDATGRDHAFLELLAESPGRVYSRQELLKRLWEIDFDPQTNVVEVFVARLRRKLGAQGARLIATVVREGYRLEIPSP
jgi:DNA-binding response OmpR family regulator